MGVEKARAEAERWHTTAIGDIKTAKILLEAGRFAHACFHAQQAGEKAVKAAWFSRDGDPWGHSVQKLIDDSESFDLEIHNALKMYVSDAAKLDRFYIPTRYPNGLPDIEPDRAFFADDAETAIALAENILSAAARLIEI